MLSETKSRKAGKKYMKHFYIGIFTLLAFSFNGCILDAFNTIVLNIPITIANISTGGLLAQNVASTSFCLSESDVYQDYVDKINEIDLLEITARPTQVAPANLSGEVVLTISRRDNNAV